MSPARIAVSATTWLVVALVGVGLVLTVAGPLLEGRAQRALLDDYRSEISSSATEQYGLQGIEVDTTAPDPGTPVAIVDIPALGLRQVVVEGAAPEQTRRGPGHVVGTAAPGQPGNSAVIGRRSLFGAPFGTLSALDAGDEIVVSTTQGQTLYVVRHVGRHEVVAPEPDAVDPQTGPATNIAAEEEIDAEPGTLPDGAVTVDELYGPSDDDRLTLVTSASSSPFAIDEALVVVAEMESVAFTPTPQGGRSAAGDGRRPAGGFDAGVALALLGFALVVVGSIAAYRRLSWRSAYLLSAPPLVAMTIVLAEQVSRSLPAWA